MLLSKFFSATVVNAPAIFFIDEDVLKVARVTDFVQYAVTPDASLFNDLFLDERKLS